MDADDPSPRRALRVGLAVLLVAPYLVWIARAPSPAAPPAWIGGVMGRALAQSIGSTLAALAVGLALFRGLRHPRWVAARESAMLWPSAVPPLFLMFALLGLWPRDVDFPFGLGAVIGVHAWIYGGLTAVGFARLDRARLGPAADAAWTMGLSETAFWTRVAWPLVRGEVATLAFFVFTACWTSFSVPLLLQGSQTATLEVAIYELIRAHGRWDQAFALVLSQAAGLMAIAAALPRARAGAAARGRPTRAFPPGAVWAALTVAPGFALVAGLMCAVARAPAAPSREVLGAWLTTACVGAGAGGLTLLLGLATAFVLPHPRFERVLLGLVAPGPVVVGFGAWLAWPMANELARLIVVLAVLSFPALYRWQIHAALSGLRTQYRVARTLGAGHFAILRDVTWPQAGPAVLGAAGLAAVWAAGDFALSGVLLGRTVTLPMLVTERLAHYDWDGAYALLPPLLLTAIGIDGVFRALARWTAGEKRWKLAYFRVVRTRASANFPNARRELD